jgi:hypothetical protein
MEAIRTSLGAVHTTEQNTALSSSRSLLRIGGICAIAGGVVTQLAGALHPVETGTIFEPAVHMREIAENPRWSGVFLGFSLGFLLLLTGLSAIADSLRNDRAHAVAQVAKQVAIATTAVALVFFVLDGFAAKIIATTFVTSGSAASLAAASAIDQVGRAYFGQWTFLCWGVTPVLFGITIVSCRAFPRWLGIAPLVSGALGITAGLIQDFSDFSLALLPLFYASVLLFNLFSIAMGIVLLRRAH